MIWILLAVAYFVVLFGALALGHAAKVGDRQMKAAMRDRHYRSLP